jgi:hypothetical protein
MPLLSKGRWIVPRRNAILDLCAGTGSWSRPYLDLGYEVYTVDVDAMLNPTFLMTVQEFLKRVQNGDIYLPPLEGILCAPPCTHFSFASTRNWRTYDKDGRTEQSLSNVAACLSLVQHLGPRWWALENPRGRLASMMNMQPAWKFQPWEYGHPYSKETWIWGTARRPEPTRIVNPLPRQDRRGGSSPKVKTERSRTPRGFAVAFAAMNSRSFQCP